MNAPVLEISRCSAVCHLIRICELLYFSHRRICFFEMLACISPHHRVGRGLAAGQLIVHFNPFSNVCASALVSRESQEGCQEGTWSYLNHGSAWHNSCHSQKTAKAWLHGLDWIECVDRSHFAVDAASEVGSCSLTLFKVCDPAVKWSASG